MKQEWDVIKQFFREKESAHKIKWGPLNKRLWNQVGKTQNVGSLPPK